MPDTTIIIKMDEQGRVDVTGPLHNKIVCYGLLEFAKQIIKDAKQSNIVQPAGQVPANFINGLKKQ